MDASRVGRIPDPPQVSGVTRALRSRGVTYSPALSTTTDVFVGVLDNAVAGGVFRRAGNPAAQKFSRINNEEEIVSTGGNTTLLFMSRESILSVAYACGMRVHSVLMFIALQAACATSTKPASFKAGAPAR